MWYTLGHAIKRATNFIAWWNQFHGAVLITFEPGGDMFASSFHVRVNPVNAVGIMGGGLALEFKKRYPAMFRDYKKLCDTGTYSAGVPSIHEVAEGEFVINLVTKTKPQYRSEMWLIENGLDGMDNLLEEACARIREKNPHFRDSDLKVAVPKLGCGLGLLNWSSVRRTIVDAIGDLPYDFYVFGDTD